MIMENESTPVRGGSRRHRHAMEREPSVRNMRAFDP